MRKMGGAYVFSDIFFFFDVFFASLDYTLYLNCGELYNTTKKLININSLFCFL